MANPIEREMVGMLTKTRKSSTEWDAPGFDYEETELTAGLPNGSRVGSEPERRRGFLETVDLTLGYSGINKRGGDRSSDSSDGEISGAGKPSTAKAQVVGWSSVRAFCWYALKSCMFMKVAVDGAPYLRKVDLDTYRGYQQLLTALEEMFSCFTISWRRAMVEFGLWGPIVLVCMRRVLGLEIRSTP